jgi:glutamyl-tRNA synthetase
MEFKNAVLDDFVILKSNRTPAFNFANVIDDHLMQITHVIRGDEHLSNTPRQVLLYGALGFDLPQFAHLPMILGPDGSKLSKRHGAVSVEWFRKEGFLADAFVNYFALLGWGTADSQQVFDSREEMIGKFSLEWVSKNPAVFDTKKLEWMNGRYIRRLGIDELVELAIPFLKESNLVKGEGSAERELVREVLKLEQERLKKLSQITEFTDFFFLKNIKYDSLAVDEILRKEGVPELLESFGKALEGTEPFDIQAVEKVTREFISERNLKAKELMQPVRVAITGKKASPGLFEVMALLGKEKVLKRLSETVSSLRGSPRKVP